MHAPPSSVPFLRRCNAACCGEWRAGEAGTVCTPCTRTDDVALRIYDFLLMRRKNMTSNFLLPICVALALISRGAALPRSERLDILAEAAAQNRPEALAELDAGEKRGHWVWWVFPALYQRGGDMNSAWQRGVRGESLGPSGADLVDASEAAAYIAHPSLRPGLIAAFRAAEQAISTAEPPAPWRVFDSGFGRASDGTWVGGPVDAYKVRCSATLFAAVAHLQNDAEVRHAAVQLLSHFHGDAAYTPGGPGTAGYQDVLAKEDGEEADGLQERMPLRGPDEGTLALVGNGVTWMDVLRAERLSV